MNKELWLGAARADILETLSGLLAASAPQVDDAEDSGGQDLLPRVAGHLLVELQRAVSWEKPAVLLDCVAWAKAVLVQSGVPDATLPFLLETVAAEVCRRFPDGIGRQASGLVLGAEQALPDLPDRQPGFLHPGAPLSPLAMLYSRALLRGDRDLASRLVLQAVEQGTPVKDIYRHVFQTAQHEIGRLWQINQISVAEEHYSTAATQLIMSQLYPYVFSGAKIGRTIVAVCVSGDLHELGARMVADFFEIEGWDSYYTGASTPTAGVLQAVVDRRADMLAISATITHHVPDVKHLIGLVRGNQACEHVKIIVGGYPFNRQPDLWRRVGADGSGPDAETAVSLANDLVGAGKRRR